MLYTSQTPILDLTDKFIKSTQDFEQIFHDLNLCSKEENKETPMAEKKPELPTNPSESLPDSDTSDDEQVNPRLRTSAEERDYGTICGSAITTHIALSHSIAQVNPIVHYVHVKKYIYRWTTVTL